MRKFSKILTVLLTLALLCGVIMSVFASAAEGESREALNITQTSYNRYDDYESGTRYVPLSYQNTGNVSVEYLTDASGNTYGRYVAKGQGTSTGNAELYVSTSDYGLGNHRNGTTNIGAHDYVVIDFELAADQYAFSYVATITLNVPGVDGAEATTETVTATLYKTVDTKAEYDAFAAAPSTLAEFINKAIYEVDGKTISNIAITVNNDLDLAHIDGMSYNLHGRGTDKLSNPGNTTVRSEIYAGTLLYTVKDKATGKWYLGTASTYGAKDNKYVEMSSELGVFTHVTYVVKTDRAASETLTTGVDISGSRAYIFVNGECVKSNINMGITTSKGTVHEAWAPAWIRVALGKDNQNRDRFSICIDNVACNWYGFRPMVETNVDGVKTYTYSTVDTVYESKGYGIDDYITSGDFATKGLWVCEDVVYNTDYVTPNKDKYFTVDGTDYYVVGAALDAMKTGSVLTAKVDILDFDPAGLQSFKVVCENGAKFTLSAAAAKYYDVIENNGVYVVAINEDAYTDGSWLNVSGEGYNRTNNFSASSSAVNDNNDETARAVKKEYVAGSSSASGYFRILNMNAYLLAQGVEATYITDRGSPENWYNTDTFAYNNSKHTAEGYKYITADIDIGTDRYTFTYEAVAKVTTVQYNADSVAGEPVAETKSVTLNKTVSSIAEYEALKKDASALLKTFSYTSRPTNGQTKNQTVYTYEVQSVTKINDDLDLAFINGQQLVGFHGRISTVLPFVSGSETCAGNLYTVKGTDGKWYLSVDGTYSDNDVLLSNEVGMYDHVSYVFQVVTAADGTIGNSMLYTFVNGKFVASEKNIAASAKAFAMQSIKMIIADSSNKNWDKYSIAVDNCAINWFKSSEALDAFLANENYKTANLDTCKDAVYYAYRYINPNGWVSLDGGQTILFTEGKINEAFASLKNGAVITSSRSFINFVPPVDSFTFVGVRGAKLTLDEYIADFYHFEKNGDVYTVRLYDENDGAPVKVYDSLGNVLYSTFLLPGKQLKLPAGLDATVFDVETKENKLLDNWYIKGTDILADGYSYATLAENPGAISVVPALKLEGVVSDYAIYTVNEYGVKQLVGSASDYASMDSFRTNIQNAPDGATAILLYDVNTKYDIGVQTNSSNAQIVIGAGKTFSLDLNGRTLVDSLSNYNVGAWGDRSGCTFNVKDGATFNFYSSKPGAAWYQLKYHYTNGDKRTYSKGIVTSDAKVATVNFGDVYDEKGNLIIDSADFTVYGSLVQAYTTSGATKDNTKFTLNVNGGNYYAFGIGRYGMIVSYLPTMTVNIRNATFINDGAFATYGIFSNQAANSDMYVNAYDSTFVCPNTYYDTQWRYHNMVYNNATGIYTEHYYEGCTIIAGRINANKITLGEGNFISCTDYESHIKFADGVSKSESNINTSVLINHPVLVNKSPVTPVYKTNENGEFVLDAEGKKIVDHYITASDIANSSFKEVIINGIAYYAIADSVYNTENWKNEVKCFAGGYITYKGEMPDVVDEVSYLTSDGKLLATVLWHEDRVDDNFALAHPASVALGMYTANGATWSATDDAFKFVLAGYTGATGTFKDMLVNAALSTGMTYNIYVPADAGITITGVEGGTLAEKLYSYNGKSYFVISTELAAADFEAKNVTVTFTAESIVGGDAVTGTQTLVADIVGYANKVNETFEHETEEAILIVNMMEYKVAVAKALALSAGTAYVETEATAAFFAAHLNCYCGDGTIEEPDEYYDIDELLKIGLKGATFTMDSVGEIKLIFEPVDAANTDLVITVKYSDLRRTYTLVATYNAEAKCYITPGIPAAYIDNAFSITVGDGEAVGIYSLYAYIVEMSKNPVENANYIYVAKALAEYAAAAEAYKYIINDEVE